MEGWKKTSMALLGIAGLICVSIDGLANHEKRHDILPTLMEDFEEVRALVEGALVKEGPW
jgi:hypothetical protein